MIVIQEIFGVHEHIKDLCRRLAKQGYLAVAPELYARQGDAGEVPDDPRADRERRLEGARCAGHGRPRRHRRVGGEEPRQHRRLAATGFCWGGRQTWLFAEHSGKLKAGGRVVRPAGRRAERAAAASPSIDGAAQLKAPVLGLYGGKDQGITAEARDRMTAALKSAPAVAADSRIVVYPDAPHGFNADYRPSYVKADAEDGWAKMLAFFKAHGVA